MGYLLWGNFAEMVIATPNVTPGYPRLSIDNTGHNRTKKKKKSPHRESLRMLLDVAGFKNGGERGIRTLGEV
jgi:hypothetical protein